MDIGLVGRTVAVMVAADGTPAPPSRSDLVAALASARDRQRTTRRRRQAVELGGAMVATGTFVLAVVAATSSGFGRADLAVMFWMPVAVVALGVFVSARSIAAQLTRRWEPAAKRATVDAGARLHAHDMIHGRSPTT